MTHLSLCDHCRHPSTGTYPGKGMDRVGTSFFCKGSWSFSEFFLVFQYCGDTGLVSVNQENLEGPVSG